MATGNFYHKFSIKDRVRSVKYAIHGLIKLFETEHNARINVVAAIIVVVAGFILKIEKWEWICIVLSIGLVFITELINTSLEKLADIINPDLNEKIGKAKDLSAAAVLVAAINALIVGCIVFIPKII